MRTTLAALALGAALPAAAAQAATWNAAADFSLASNPNGVWVYGYGNNDGSGFVASPMAMAENNASYRAWWGQIVQGTSSVIWHTPGQYMSYLPGLKVHPGPSYAAILRFVAPSAGGYVFDAVFRRGDTSGWTGAQAAIFQGGNSLRSLADVPDALLPGLVYSNVAVTLAAGEALSFVVDGAGSWGYDNTVIDLTIRTAAVPAPAGLGLLGFGLAALVATGFRGRSARMA
jgi:hypothetical protein